jgi:hypothetical protein
MSNLTVIGKTVDVSGALEVIDQLRADVESGRIKFFTAIGIASDHETLCYQSAVKPTSRLEAFGAASHLLHCHLHGDLDND